MRIYLWVILSVLIFLTPVLANQTESSPAGLWTTIDDVTGKPKSIIKISEDQNHIFSGRVVHIYPKPGKNEKEVCEACTGEKHNQAIVGMVIMTGFKQDGEIWDEGEILDPNNGKVYSCSMRMSKDGKQLKVHGYIGISILGRTQTWIRK